MLLSIVLVVFCYISCGSDLSVNLVIWNVEITGFNQYLKVLVYDLTSVFAVSVISGFNRYFKVLVIPVHRPLVDGASILMMMALLLVLFLL